MTGIRAIQLDTQNAEVTFSVKWFGIIPVTGRFDSLLGVVTLPDDGVEGAVVTIDVDADSIRTGVGLRDRHLRGPRFLDSARFPCISFRSNRIAHGNGSLSVEGTLSLKGIEQFVKVNCAQQDARRAGRQATKLSAELTLERGAFGVGKPRGLLAYSPLFGAISDDIRVSVRLTVPALSAAPMVQPALGR